MSDFTLKELSKILSHALRHQPSLYNINLDKDGWANLDLLISSLKKIDKKYNNLTIIEIKKMIASSDKKRHELQGGRIRASYGHSIDKKIINKTSKPPNYLFHATKAKTLSSIFEKGLLPMKRQYVHLSENKEDAIIVALRKTKEPVLLRIDSEEAYLKGVNFYSVADNLWLSDKISPKYLEKVEC